MSLTCRLWADLFCPQLFAELLRAQDARPSMEDISSEAQREASLAPTDITDIVMEDVDNGAGFGPGDYGPSDGPSQPQP